VKNYSGMYLTKDNEDFDDDHLKLYRRKSDKLKLGDIPLTSIEYLTKDGRIFRVQIFFYESVNLTKADHALRYAYGKPTKTYSHQSNWEGKKVLMFYTQTENYEGRPTGILQIYSAPLFYEDTNKEKARKAQELRKAVSDL
jgi:hypothetical protein